MNPFKAEYRTYILGAGLSSLSGGRIMVDTIGPKILCLLANKQGKLDATLPSSISDPESIHISFKRDICQRENPK